MGTSHGEAGEGRFFLYILVYKQTHYRTVLIDVGQNNGIITTTDGWMQQDRRRMPRIYTVSYITLLLSIISIQIGFK